MINDHYQNVGMKGFFKRYGVINGLKRGLFNGCPIHIVKDYEVRKLLWQKQALGTIRKYVKYADETPEGLSFPAENVPEDPVWVYWNTGFETAPDIVRACLRSIERYAGRPVIRLSEENIAEYLVLPSEIKEKIDRGNISIAAYSDLMRFSLLEHYGGSWIDATVLLTGPIQEEILSADFFALQNSLCLIDNPVLYPAWFLRAKPGNEIIRRTRNIAFAYWKRNSHVIEYLLPNLILTEVIHNSGEEAKIPYMNTDYSERMVRCIADPYDEKAFRWLCSLTNIHKLTYKFDSAIAAEDNLYTHIIKTEKGDAEE